MTLPAQARRAVSLAQLYCDAADVSGRTMDLDAHRGELRLVRERGQCGGARHGKSCGFEEAQVFGARAGRSWGTET
ncbi:hypothetical protein SY2F82_11970 [Streptomyces sp. Y2F8-2]|nr:hypothetical protein SY2F82_11970 [Streptomyces sp. Y2F8-2]